MFISTKVDARFLLPHLSKFNSTVRVPHDWAIAGPFDPNESGFAAKLPWRGVGWYRRSFTLDCQKDEQVYLDFDGVMAFPKVYINGHLAGQWDYGYTSYRLRWNNVVYEPGELVAVGYKDGKEVGRAKMQTASAPAAIRLTPDRTKVNAAGEDLCYLLVEAVDQKGVLCPLADNMVHFDVTGPGEIVGVGNGNPMSLESFQANERKLFFGKAMLILRTVEGKTGEIQVTAKSPKLAGATANISCSIPTRATGR